MPVEDYEGRCRVGVVQGGGIKNNREAQPLERSHEGSPQECGSILSIVLEP